MERGKQTSRTKRNFILWQCDCIEKTDRRSRTKRKGNKKTNAGNDRRDGSEKTKRAGTAISLWWSGKTELYQKYKRSNIEKRCYDFR